MKKFIAYFIALSVSFAGCALAASSSSDNKTTIKPTDMCVNYNKLTKDQKADIDKIASDTEEKVMPLRQKLMTDFEMLHTQIMQSPIDENAINKTSKEIIDTKSQIFLTHIQSAIQIEKKYGFVPMCCLMKKGHCPMMKKGITRQSDLEAVMIVYPKD